MNTGKSENGQEDVSGIPAVGYPVLQAKDDRGVREGAGMLSDPEYKLRMTIIRMTIIRMTKPRMTKTGTVAEV